MLRIATRFLWFSAGFCLILPQVSAVDVVIMNNSGERVDSGCQLKNLNVSAGQVQLQVADDSCLQSGGGVTQEIATSPTSLSIAPSQSKTFSLSLSTTPSSPVEITYVRPSRVTSISPPSPITLNDTTPVSVTVTAGATTGSSQSLNLATSSSYAGGVLSDVSVSVVDICTDPLTDPWAPDAACGLADNLTVIDHAADDQTFIPGTTAHARSFSGSIVYGDVWAVRNYFSTTTDFIDANLRSADALEGTANYTFAISRIPGSFTQTYDENDATIALPSVCIKSGQLSPSGSAMSISARIRSLATSSRCPLDPNSMYYVNMKADTTSCGSSTTCRNQTKATWPH